MMEIAQALKAQIEAAYDYRGHVTVALKDGSAVEGFLFNRQYASAKQPESFVDLILKNKDENRRIAVADIASIALTGEDCAAGKSYADYLAKTQAKTSAP